MFGWDDSCCTPYERGTRRKLTATLQIETVLQENEICDIGRSSFIEVPQRPAHPFAPPQNVCDVRIRGQKVCVGAHYFAML